MLTYKKRREKRAQQGTQGQLQHDGAPLSRRAQGKHYERRRNDQGDQGRKHFPGQMRANEVVRDVMVDGFRSVGLSLCSSSLNLL